MPVGFVYAVLIITVVVIAVVAIAPAITAGRGGKILVFLGLFILPVLSAGLGYEHHMDRSKRTTFCLSCHVMEPYGRSLNVDDKTWLPAAHRDAGGRSSFAFGRCLRIGILCGQDS